ncbi:SDR family NAD(P)-dependent oxidoreductase [Levilactobacillus bambusae]|uniref:Short-chain dehydrogenase n=1 Tax=Levilactobacillus bambusae TaxID=2024736 RepID=A0A2V1N2K2_9LACO|nr:SDR family NAD(P)-dependent oxidoreductase [Levilactobacillus bambusae]PWG00476.1 short-chain dehydrogenase [Levilactobacillus bambusae]
MKKIAVVTGASSGIGKQTAFQLQRAGYQVIGGARHINDSELNSMGIITRSLDITDPESNQAFANAVLSRFHRIDLIVNSAGYGLFGALEEVDSDAAKHQLDVNVFGTMDLTRRFIPTMRSQGFGRIINVSSLAGQSYTQLAGWYHVSKHALETMSDVLRLELAPFGLQVVIVEPGITKTNWANVTNQLLLKTTKPDSPYRRLAEKQAQTITQASQTAEEVAQIITKAALSKHPKIRYQITRTDRIMMHLSSPKLGYRLQDWFAKRMMN